MWDLLCDGMGVAVALLAFHCGRYDEIELGYRLLTAHLIRCGALAGSVTQNSQFECGCENVGTVGECQCWYEVKTTDESSVSHFVWVP